MDLVIVTGMSGAGKSKTINALEDLGFYCIDNLPPILLGKFLDFCRHTPVPMEHIAIVIDVRGRELLCDFAPSLEEARKEGNTFRLIYLDCEDETILHRYKETRRCHPLMTGDCVTLEEALVQERALLEPARKQADYYIDTTLLTASQLKERINSIFTGDNSAMLVQCMSFGFKYGIPPEADFVLDLRSLPNPFYVPELKHRTGMDKPVYDYVFSFCESNDLYTKFQDITELLLRLAETEGRSQFTIAVGCTGGHHRSVSFARRIAADLAKTHRNVRTIHRDIEK